MRSKSKGVNSMFLKKFYLLNANEELKILCNDQRRIYNNTYPLHIFPDKSLELIEFDKITIFCGGNGCGKTTLLNIIANKLNAQRKNTFNKGNRFDSYVELCSYEIGINDPSEIKMISSDDVFDYLLDVRSINQHVNRIKERLGKEYLEHKYNNYETSFELYDEIKRENDIKTKTMSKYIRERIGNNNIVEQSNGESALMFWEKEIKENGIYILDEPENSLSAENQLKLKKFIEDSARFYNCQFIISTHSPFILSLNSAKIYNLDMNNVEVQKWTNLPNVRIYYNFFKENKDEFDT